jgi:transposase Tn5 family protein
LTSFILKRPIVDGTPPTAREYVRMVSSLGGFLGRKCDGEPGTKSIWLGQQRLDDIKMTYRFLVPQLRPPPVPGAYTYGAS